MGINNNRYALVKPLAATIAMVVAGYGQAQEGEAVAKNSSLLEEVVVVARKVAENQQEVPVAITSFTADSMEIHTVEQLNDIGSLTPGLSLSAGIGYTTSANVAIRGQSEVESQLVLDPAVGVYVDGVYLGRSQALAINLYDLQQIEVLKGPQGTLFGRNTTGGAVIVTTADPTEELEGNLKVTLGNYGRSNVQGAISLPMTEDMGVRLAANIQNRDGFVENAFNGDDIEDEDSKSYRLKWLWTPGDWEVRLNADYAEAENNGIANRATPIGACDPFVGFGAQAIFNPRCGTDANQAIITGFYGPAGPFGPGGPLDVGSGTGLLVPDGMGGLALPPNLQNIARGIALVTGAPPQALIDNVLAQSAQVTNDPYRVFQNVTGINEVEDQGVSFSLAYSLENIEVKSITAYREIDARRLVDTDATILPLLEVDGGVEQDQISQELQINGSALDDRLSYSTGLYYFKEEGTDIVDQNIGGLTSVTTLINDAENKSLGAFLQGSYDLTDELSLNFGWRRTKDERQVTVRHQALAAFAANPAFCDLEPALVAAFGTPGTCAATLDSTFYGTSLLAGLDYQLSEDKLLYLTYREGFRSGGFSGRAGSLAQLNAVPPEELTDYEIGFKGDWELGGGMQARTNIAVYFSEIDNRQRSFTRQTPTGGLTTIIESAAEGEVSGFEAEIILVANENLSFNLGLSHIDAKHKVFIDSQGVDRSNDPVPQSPENSYNIGVTYQLDLASGGKAVATLDYNWLDEQSFGFDPDPTVTSDSYGLVNARAGWSEIMGSAFSVHVWGRNLADEEYIVGGVFLANNFGYSANNLGEPRTFGVDLSYDF